MSTVVCRSCGEEERLKGTPMGHRIFIACNACGDGWFRDLRPRCVYCDSEDLRSTPMPIWSKGRGTMRTPTGTREAWTCQRCGSTDATRKRDSEPETEGEELQ
jgi:hypothetical protein